MSTSTVDDFHRQVIAEVIKQARNEFLNEGNDETPLIELQQLWESKLFPNQSGTFTEGEDAYNNDYQEFELYNQEYPQSFQTSAANIAALSQAPARPNASLDDEYGRPKPFMQTKPKPGTQNRQYPFQGQYDGQSDISDNEDAGKADDGDESLHSDLDDPNEDDDNAETDDVILCLYEKVTRTRNKWRFTLKDGIMHIDGRDHLFHRANGELEW